jgi:hypothetical protein
MVQERVKWRAGVNTVMNIQVKVKLSLRLIN